MQQLKDVFGGAFISNTMQDLDESPWKVRFFRLEDCDEITQTRSTVKTMKTYGHAYVSTFLVNIYFQ